MGSMQANVTLGSSSRDDGKPQSLSVLSVPQSPGQIQAATERLHLPGRSHKRRRRRKNVPSYRWEIEAQLS